MRSAFGATLNTTSICSSAAIERAQHDYRDVTKNREIQRALPEAWAKLVAEDNETLIALLAERVESVCGFKPEPEIVGQFLRAASGHRIDVPMISPRPHTPTRTPTTTARPSTQATPIATPEPLVDRGRGVEFLGVWHPARSGSDVLVRIAQLMADRDPQFPERFEASPRRSRKRTSIARSPDALFPANLALAAETSARREFHPGWWIDTNLSTGSKLMLIQRMCEVAGLGYNVEVKPVL